MDIPPQFNHPYSGQIIEQRLDHATLRILCGSDIACSVHKDGKCYIWMVVWATPDVRAHEVAHCNGWKHD